MLQIANDIRSKAAGRKIAVVGVGAFCTLNMRFLMELNLDIDFFVDLDWENRKYFEYQTGFRVMPYEALERSKHFPFVYQHNFQVIDSVVSSLRDHGFAKDDYLLLSDVADRDLLYRGMQIGKGASSYDVMLDWYTDVASIGRYSSINHTAQVVHDHNTSLLTTANLRSAPPPHRKRMSIGHDVWIGANVVINSSKVRHIGDGAIIGTGSVVIEDVPSYAVITGIPGKVKKYRFTEEEIAILEHVQWWNWNEAEIRTNEDCFKSPKLFFERFKFRNE